MNEDQLLALASDKNFIKTLKNISNIDELIMFMKKKNVLITNDEANKLLEALHYFTFKKDIDSSSEIDSNVKQSDKASGNYNKLDESDLDVGAGVSEYTNPYIGILRRLF